MMFTKEEATVHAPNSEQLHTSHLSLLSMHHTVEGCICLCLGGNISETLQNGHHLSLLIHTISRKALYEYSSISVPSPTFVLRER